jgi:hypothetical protein
MGLNKIIFCSKIHKKRNCVCTYLHVPRTFYVTTFVLVPTAGGLGSTLRFIHTLFKKYFSSRCKRSWKVANIAQ